MASVILMPLPSADVTDTTPRLSALVGDPVKQSKARFSVYQSDGVTLIGIVDSSYISGNGIASVSYGTALPSGTYKLSAIAMDDAGGSSSPVPIMLTFYVLAVSFKDLGIVYNVASPMTQVQKDLSILYDTTENNAKMLTMFWDTQVPVVKDLFILWDINTSWQRVTEPPTIWVDEG